jgi:predicted RNA-binding Zn-ribbon protein involved in translation (DUF1610 family)
MDISSSTFQRCRVCRCFLESEDLFCANCGTENREATVAAQQEQAFSAGSKVATTQIASVYAFQCHSCGASMSYDASAQALRCPFCGSTEMHELKDARTLQADAVIPLEVDRSKVEQSLRKWLASGFWTPNDTANASVIASATPVYIPFWVFTASTDTYWTADESSPAGYRAQWIGVSGKHQGQHTGIMIQASSVLSAGEMEYIMPYDLRHRVAPTSVDLVNFVVEDFRLASRDARMLARAKIESDDARQVTQYLRGSNRNVRVNAMISNMSGQPLLAPVWIMVYHYNKHPYRVLINGQTGKTHGTTPISMVKVSVAVLIVVTVVAIIALIIFLTQVAG